MPILSLGKHKESKSNNGLKETKDKSKLKKKIKVPPSESGNQDLLLSISSGIKSESYCDLENEEAKPTSSKKKKHSEKKEKKKNKTDSKRNHVSDNSPAAVTLEWKPLAKNKCLTMVLKI